MASEKVNKPNYLESICRCYFSISDSFRDVLSFTKGYCSYVLRAGECIIVECGYFGKLKKYGFLFNNVYQIVILMIDIIAQWVHKRKRLRHAHVV